MTSGTRSLGARMRREREALAARARPERETVHTAVRFGVVGGGCFLLTMAIYALLLAVGVGPVLAGTIGYACGIVAGFAANRSWTFRHTSGRTHHQAMRYLVVCGLGIGVNALLLHLIVVVAGAPEILGELLAMVVIAPMTFLGNRHWSFRAR